MPNIDNNDELKFAALGCSKETRLAFYPSENFEYEELFIRTSPMFKYETVFGNYKEAIYSCKENSSMYEKVGVLSMYLRDILVQNENQKLFFTDKNGNGYINSTDNYFGEFDDYFNYFLDAIEAFYKHIRNNPTEYHYEEASERYRWLTYNRLRISERDFWIIDSIFYDQENYRVLLTNNYRNMPKKDDCTSPEEHLYCDRVIKVLREIMIKNFNFQRYWPYLMEEVINILKVVEENYDSHLAQARGNNRQNKKVIIDRLGIIQ